VWTQKATAKAERSSRQRSGVPNSRCGRPLHARGPVPSDPHAPPACLVAERPSRIATCCTAAQRCLPRTFAVAVRWPVHTKGAVDASHRRPTMPSGDATVRVAVVELSLAPCLPHTNDTLPATMRRRLESLPGRALRAQDHLGKRRRRCDQVDPPALVSFSGAFDREGAIYTLRALHTLTLHCKHLTIYRTLTLHRPNATCPPPQHADRTCGDSVPGRGASYVPMIPNVPPSPARWEGGFLRSDSPHVGSGADTP
jgi:hypothetical protein